MLSKEIDIYRSALAAYDQAEAGRRQALLDLQQKREALDIARKAELERIMSEQGLTLCSRYHYALSTGEEDLGIIKDSEARLFRSTQGNSYDTHLVISRLCPKHAPSDDALDKPELIRGISDYKSYVTEVFRQPDGRINSKS
jgi:hypothetical protein